MIEHRLIERVIAAIGELAFGGGIIHERYRRAAEKAEAHFGRGGGE